MSWTRRDGKGLFVFRLLPSVQSWASGEAGWGEGISLSSEENNGPLEAGCLPVTPPQSSQETTQLERPGLSPTVPQWGGVMRHPGHHQLGPGT